MGVSAWVHKNLMASLLTENKSGVTSILKLAELKQLWQFELVHDVYEMLLETIIWTIGDQQTSFQTFRILEALLTPRAKNSETYIPTVTNKSLAVHFKR